MPPIALITDFGMSDHFVGSMKAAILGINPRASIIDVSHDIQPGDVMGAATMLLLCFRDFPKATIFTVVVDPGVGSDRAALAVKAGGCYFVGPDNGVLSLACEKIPAAFANARARRPVVRKLENESYFRTPVSGTFHGRDIFGPVAAHLSKGLSFAKLGPVLESMERLTIPRVKVESRRIAGAVIAIDRFGNCITSIEKPHLEKLSTAGFSVAVKSVKPFPVCSCYKDGASGKPLGIMGSTGHLEISVSGGNAARKLKLNIGDRVEVNGAPPLISPRRGKLSRRGGS